LTVEVTMPRLSDSMEEGTILRWLRAAGDVVRKGDDLVEIETDKATMVYEAEAEGTVLEILVQEGAVAAVGAVIALLANGAEHPESPAAAARPAARSAEAPRIERTSAPEAARRPRATPVARRTAAELGISLADVAGTGPDGRIGLEDVRSAAGRGGAPAPPARAAGEAQDRGVPEIVALTATQRTIARRMTESTSTIPQFTVTVEIDMEAAAGLRESLKEVTPEAAPSMNDLVVKAAALTLREQPAFNSSWDDGRLLRWPRVNVGVAVALDDALLVPAVFDADVKSLGQIALETRGFAERARSSTLTAAELTAGTFTVSNLGMLGVRRFTAVVNPPQVAILAVGAVESRPVVDADGHISARRLMDATLTCDHRVVYGADGARFLTRLRAFLERPLTLTF